MVTQGNTMATQWQHKATQWQHNGNPNGNFHDSDEIIVTDYYSLSQYSKAFDVNMYS